MSITFTPVLKKRYKKDKTGIINIRKTENRTSQYFPMGIPLSEKYWNKKSKNVENKLRDLHDFDENERKLIITKIKSKIKELDEIYNGDVIVNPVPPINNQSFLIQLIKHINFLEERRQIGTSKRYGTTLHHIKTFLKEENKSDLTFDDLTSSFIEEFETYLIGIGLLKNTTKNYINCIKRLYVKLVKSGLYYSKLDPFANFKNVRTPVEKGFLEKKYVDYIRLLKLDENTPLYHTRNYFLFQIFGQGLRVSDLLTLRFGKIKEGAIKFFQYKTRKFHRIHLTEANVFLLKNYINDKSVEDVFKLKYKYNFKNKVCKNTYMEIQIKYTELTELFIKTPLDKIEERKVMIKDVELYKKTLDDVRKNVFERLLIILHNYSKIHKNDFIFPILNPELYKDVDFNENTSLTKPQYNHLQSKTTIYNKMLKKLQKEVFEQFQVNFDITLTSHVARHTYTNLMLQIDGDVYEISNSLGHQGILTTQNYITPFQERIKKSNQDLGDNFSYFME